MQSVKRFLARGRIEAPYTEPSGNITSRWRAVCPKDCRQPALSEKQPSVLQAQGKAGSHFALKTLDKRKVCGVVRHLMVQVAEGLQLSGEQRRSVACLWRNFDGRLDRILAARRGLHAQIAASMPNGVMGRDFAINFLKVGLPWLPKLLMDALKQLAALNRSLPFGTLIVHCLYLLLSMWGTLEVFLTSGNSAVSTIFTSQAHEGMDALMFNLRQEHVVICDFVSTFHQVCLHEYSNLANI